MDFEDGCVNCALGKWNFFCWVRFNWGLGFMLFVIRLCILLFLNGLAVRDLSVIAVNDKQIEVWFKQSVV